MGAFLFKTGSHLFARCAVDALVSDAALPMLQAEVFFSCRAQAPAFERVVTQVGNSPFYFTFVLWLTGATGHHMQVVMPAKVRQLRVNLGIKPVGLQYRRLHIVEIEQRFEPLNFDL